MEKKTTKIKITKTKYIVEVSNETFEYDTFEAAERRIKGVYSSEIEGYLIKQEYEDDKLVNEFLIG
jgi:hypothetical protein